MTTGVAYWHVCMHWLLQSRLGLRFADVISEDGPAWLPASTACLQGKHEGLCMAGKSFPFLDRHTLTPLDRHDCSDALTCNAASQHRLPSEYAWKGWV